MSVRILVGDCRERLRDLDDASVDSCVCDPPYHLTSIVKRFSKAKPRNHLHDKHKGNIKAGQYSRLSKGFMGQSWDGGDVAFDPDTWAEVMRVLKPGGYLVAFSGTRTYHRMACSIEDAGFEIRDQIGWLYGSGFPKSHDLGEGWGTALKPAWEPICLARKPLEGTGIANREAYGTGGLNIDACRIETDEIIEQSGEKVDIARGKTHAGYDRPNATMFRTGKPKERGGPANEQGRWPANLVHDGCDESEEFRYFYCAKPSTEERGEGNNHPTVKPISLMRWLCRLVTPKGGTVLDPFMGSGSTGIAADAEQFNFIGCEMSPDYAAIAERRIRDAAGMFAEVKAA